MIHIGLFTSSAVIFFLGMAYFLLLSPMREKGFSKLYIGNLVAVVAASFLPIYISGNLYAEGGMVDTALVAILGVVRSITGENSVFDTRSMLSDIPQSLTIAVNVYTAFLHLVSVMLILGFILSLFKDIFPKVAYRFFARKPLYVFSQINERSLLLAKDIKDNKSSVIVFLGDPADSRSTAHTELINEMDAFVFNLSPSELKLYNRKATEKTHIFLIDEDESQNLKKALETVHHYRENEPVCPVQVHILCSQPEAEGLVDALEVKPKEEAEGDVKKKKAKRRRKKKGEETSKKPKLTVRLIRESRSALYHLVDTRPLFTGVRNGKLKILIVGAGRSGLEAIKLCAWCGRTLNIKPEIIVVDNNPLLESYFEKSCPELAPQTATRDSREDVNITFHTADVQSKEFVDILRSYVDIGYVICALGDDHLNLRTAVSTRGILEEVRFLQDRETPVQPPAMINVLLQDPFLYDVSDKMKFDNKTACALSPFGSLRETYTWDNIVAPYLDFAGMAVNRFHHLNYRTKDMTKAEKAAALPSLNDEADAVYETKEYNRSSSIAQALHMKYKVYACLHEVKGVNIDPKVWKLPITTDMVKEVNAMILDKQSGEALVRRLGDVEHSRWNAYMRGQGWSYASGEVADYWYKELGGYRNFPAKLHPCLVPWEELPRVDKWLLENHNYLEDFQELDCIFVRNMPEIIEESLKLSEQGTK